VSPQTTCGISALRKASTSPQQLGKRFKAKVYQRARSVARFYSSLYKGPPLSPFRIRPSGVLWRDATQRTPDGRPSARKGADQARPSSSAHDRGAVASRAVAPARVTNDNEIGSGNAMILDPYGRILFTSVLMGRDYLGEEKRTMESLGLSGYAAEELAQPLE